MADKGLIESARRMYGAKDAARQEAKKDMLRSGEILYRGLRDFGVAKLREDTLRRSEAARQQAMEVSERRFQESMSFRQQQMDWQKLKYEEAQQNREYDMLASNTTQVQSALSELNENPALLLGDSLNIEKNEIADISTRIAKRDGDPVELAKKRQDLLSNLTKASGEYNELVGDLQDVFGMNLQDPNATANFNIMSNDPKSLRSKNMMSTFVKGLKTMPGGDGSSRVTMENGNLMLYAKWDGENITKLSYRESGIGDYNLKNGGKGPAIEQITQNYIENATKGVKVNPDLIATAYQTGLSEEQVNSLARDYDLPGNGNDTSTYKYNRFVDEYGIRRNYINKDWVGVQNIWWEEKIAENNWKQTFNSEGSIFNRTSWEDSDGNKYERQLFKFDNNQTGADSVWTKNGKPFEWWDDKSWSGDNGTGIKLRDAWSQWLGDTSANFINEKYYKPQTSSGTDLGIANARADINTMVNLIESGKLEGIGEIYTKRYKGTGDKGRYSFIGEMDPDTELPTGTFGFYRDMAQSGTPNPLPYSDTKYTMSNTIDGKMELLNTIVNTRFGGTDVSNLWNDKTEAGQNFRNQIRSMFTEKDIKEVTPTPDSNIRKGGAAEVVVAENLEKMTIANEQLNQIDVVVDKAISDYADNKNWKSIYSTINNYIIGQKGKVSAGEDLLNQWSIPASVSAEEKQSIENEVDAQIQTGFSDLDFGSMGTLDRDKVRKILTYVEYRIRNKK